MAEPLGDDLERLACGQRRRGVAVAETVQGDRRQARILHQSLEALGDALGVEDLAVFAGEHQPGIGPRRPPGQALLELLDPVGLECGSCERVEGELSPASGGLGFGDDDWAPVEDHHHTLDPLDDRVEATVRAMGRPGEQTFAIDQELLAEVRQLTVPQLRQERDRLRQLLAGALASVAHRIALAEERQRQAEAHLADGEAASPATGGWAGRAWRRRSLDPGWAGGQPAMARAAAVRVADQAAAELVDLRRQQQQRAGFLEHHQPAADRYRAVVAELGWRTRATSRALELDPPAWLTGLLGDPPDNGRGRRAWRQTAARLHSYRDSYQLSGPERALGQEPTGDLTQRRAWRAARQAIDRYQRQHRVCEQRQERPQERDQTSTRTRAQARDREREAG